MRHPTRRAQAAALGPWRNEAIAQTASRGLVRGCAGDREIPFRIKYYKRLTIVRAIGAGAERGRLDRRGTDE